MRPRVEWMTQADERVLEFLHTKDIVASPSVIAANIDYSQQYMSRRCQTLAEHGLIQRVDGSNYRITDVGERFLSGDLTSDEIETIENGS